MAKIKVTYTHPAKKKSFTGVVESFNKTAKTFTVDKGFKFDVATGKQVEGSGGRKVTEGLDTVQKRFAEKYGEAEPKKKISLKTPPAPKKPVNKFDFRIRVDNLNLVAEVTAPVIDKTTKEVIRIDWRFAGYYTSIEGCCRGILNEVSRQVLGKKKAVELEDIAKAQDEIRNLLMERIKSDESLFVFTEGFIEKNKAKSKKSPSKK